MDEIHSRALKQCRSKLVKNIPAASEFWDLIAEKEIFSTLVLEIIEAEKSRPDRVRSLLDNLIMRGPDAYDSFLYCLDNSENRHLANLIREKEQIMRNQNQQSVLQEARFTYPSQSTDPRNKEILQHSISAQTISDPSPQMNSSQSAPNLASSGSIVASPREEIEIQDITNRKEVQGNSNFQSETGYNEDVRMDVADHINPGISNPLPGAESSRSCSSGGLGRYNIRTDPRGIALIINNINFVKNQNRHGAEIDQERLAEMFSIFRFEILVHIDKTAQEIKEILKDFSKDKQLFKVDSLVVVLMSHGNNEIILGTDGEGKNIIDLISLFNSKNCTSMAGKPKMFIINACRDDGMDKKFGKTRPVDDVHDTLHTDGLRFNPLTDCDFLIAYSTFIGCVSYRYDDDGSPFVKYLVEVFKKMAHSVHVSDMLTEVNNRISGSQIQISNPTSTLRFKWYLI